MCAATTMRWRVVLCVAWPLCRAVAHLLEEVQHVLGGVGAALHLLAKLVHLGLPCGGGGREGRSRRQHHCHCHCHCNRPLPLAPRACAPPPTPTPPARTVYASSETRGRSPLLCGAGAGALVSESPVLSSVIGGVCA